ncbi:MAG: hypothetical protein OP8BY_0548 [Candidatus Saccharicenans subterraneus]|uniref:Uncharacterized protein n=1 Tax=Candidatus Saccharicenans subterraneus TaxID=2508984 RepID=A0A3E2BKI5_9BACT|nr:MAG: hypothetical protein OP8BY_0548 [Candidatus Saccharicenans subterraneum]
MPLARAQLKPILPAAVSESQTPGSLTGFTPMSVRARIG